MLAWHHGQRTTDRRRGVTLVEMLVTVAVLVIMMTILVQIFQAATGSVSAAQAYQQLDDQLRRLDGIIRGDLEGVTARFTPPLDPAQNLGYFEYGENEFADMQGEDCDDYIRFTAKAPPGRPFTGRFWPNYWSNAAGTQIFGPVPPGQNTTGNLASFPITVTSDYAEVIYFLRNGNLYRRVLLVAPELQSAVIPTVSSVPGPVNNLAYDPLNPLNPTTFHFQPSIFGGATNVSWQGVNDLSARPAGRGPLPGSTPLAQAQATIVLNTLGDLTNRENRFAYPRFADDYATPTGGGVNGGFTVVPDGLPDDRNQDNVPDLYPTLYPHVFNTALICEPNYGRDNTAINLLAFPYVFPGAYTKAQALQTDQYGWIHAPAPYANANGQLVRFDTGGLTYLQNLNHNPLDVGDNLPTPTDPTIQGGGTLASMEQTWWGFPTWRETLSQAWTDPTFQVNVNHFQPVGLAYNGVMNVQAGVLVNPGTNGNLLPPMAAPSNFTGNFSIYRQSQQLFSDGMGGGSSFWTGANNLSLWSQDWEDDLIMTGVRSFDVKAYDNALGNYADLGWGDDIRLVQNATNLQLGLDANATHPQAPYLAGSYDELSQSYSVPAFKFVSNQYFDLLNQTFAHEGRMPPLTSDHRLDASTPNPNYPGLSPLASTPLSQTIVNARNYTGNVGDDNNGVVRLRRVWDTWSTDYSRAPATGVNTAPNAGGFPVGPPFSPPVYPSYPPPYPAPLRGLQIQIRVVDPTNQRIKSLTIRQDFTHKL